MTRKRYLNILAFFVFIVLLDRGLGMGLRAGFDRTRTGEMGGMVNQALAANADVVILGSSRAWHHYDSQILRDNLGYSVFNAGCDGQGLPYISVLAEMLMQKSPPRILIINIDAQTLKYSKDSIDRLTRLAPFLDRSEKLGDLIYERGPFEQIKYLSQAYRFNSHLLPILRNIIREDSSIAGYVPIDRKMKMPTAAAMEKLQMPAATDDADIPTFDAKFIALLGETIEQAQDHGTHVILATSPRWTPDGTLAPASKLAFDQIKELAASWNVPYIAIQTENAPIFRDASFYADAHHLNLQGATEFSKRLALQLLDLDGFDWPRQTASAN